MKTACSVVVSFMFFENISSKSVSSGTLMEPAVGLTAIISGAVLSSGPPPGDPNFAQADNKRPAPIKPRRYFATPFGFKRLL